MGVPNSCLQFTPTRYARRWSLNDKVLRSEVSCLEWKRAPMLAAAGRRTMLIVACLALGAAGSLAQEGHPLTGSWHGDWGASATQRTPVFIFMKWDSKNITGSINPG